MRDRRHFWLAVLAVLLVSLAFTPVQSQGVAGDILGRINNLRSSLGLAGYRTNAALAAAAQAHAQWMATNQQISHTQPNGSTPRTRAAAAGYSSTWVSENIYGGTNASVATAWNFWINSPIHYRGLTNANYQDIGIGVASANGWTCYVLVFGNPGGASVSAPPRNNNNGRDANAAPPPSFVVGVDNNGNIMHEIQQGHTVGDIALIYGYSWDDIPAMLELNDMGENDIRLLKVGGIFLVPPYEGTYTPTALPEGYPTATPESAAFVETAIARANQRATEAAKRLKTSTPTPVLLDADESGSEIGAAATARDVPNAMLIAADPTPVTPSLTPEPTPSAPTAVAQVPTTAALADTETETVVIVREDTSPWLIVAVVLQAVIVVGAGYEFLRRARRR